jgi:hypothetical protein
MTSKANESASRKSKPSIAGQSAWVVKPEMTITLLLPRLEGKYRITDFAQGARETVPFNRKTIST